MVWCHSPPTGTEVKNVFSLYLHSSYVFMLWCIIKHRGTLPFMVWCLVCFGGGTKFHPQGMWYKIYSEILISLLFRHNFYLCVPNITLTELNDKFSLTGCPLPPHSTPDKRKIYYSCYWRHSSWISVLCMSVTVSCQRIALSSRHATKWQLFWLKTHSVPCPLDTDLSFWQCSTLKPYGQKLASCKSCAWSTFCSGNQYVTFLWCTLYGNVLHYSS
jgi:hypothetical protein